jgi:hypothetical protein
MEVINGRFGKQVPDDLSKRLREMADEVDKGYITGMIVAYIGDGDYSFIFGTSLSESILLAALMQQESIDRMRKWHD